MFTALLSGDVMEYEDAPQAEADYLRAEHEEYVAEPPDTISRNGCRNRWQCGCRQHGGVLVMRAKPDDPDIDGMRNALERIVAVNGCECDSYHGHRCLMCKVRQMARDGLSR